MASETSPTVLQWIVDTRKLWLVDGKDGKVADLKVRAAKALGLLTEDERIRALKYYFPKDAKMSIVSHLLKRMAIVTLCKVPWDKAIVSRHSNHKPYFLNTELNIPDPNISFNVSHQAGIVTLVAIGNSSIEVGTDVVCANERGDKENDFFKWVDMHADVFHPKEMEYVRRNPTNLNLDLPDDLPEALKVQISACRVKGRTLRAGTIEIASDVVVDAKLRRFYAAWSLREAFIKMQGEALLADWLQELAFQNVRAPKPAPNSPSDDAESQGELVTDYEVILKGKVYPDALIEVRALGQHFMVGTVLHSDTDKDSVPRSLPGFKHLGEDDFYAVASQI